MSHDDEYTAYVGGRLPWLRRIAFLLCQDWHRADDLVQTAITRLYVKWRRAHRADDLDAYVVPGHRCHLVGHGTAGTGRRRGRRRGDRHAARLRRRAGDPGPSVDAPPVDTLVTVDTTSGRKLSSVKFRGAPKNFHASQMAGWRGSNEVMVTSPVMGGGWPEKASTPTLGEVVYAVNVTTGEVRKVATYSYLAWAGSLVIAGM